MPGWGPRFAGVAYAIAALACCDPAMADEDTGNTFEVGGLLFGDVYAIPRHHTSVGDGASGFVLRRGYLTADFSLEETFT